MHLAASAALVLPILAGIAQLWFPGPLFRATGANLLFVLVAASIFTTGPLLTLAVFKAGKWGMTFDVTVIVTLQCMTAIAGGYVIGSVRPVFIVAAVDRLVVVSASEVTDVDLAQAVDPRFARRSVTGPLLVAAIMPASEHERSELAFSALSGRDLQNQPKYFVDYDVGSQVLRKAAKPLSALEPKHPEAASELEGWASKNLPSTGPVVWVPLQARKQDMVMLLDPASARPIRAFDIDPW